jgi:hypothetical protein
MDIWSLLDWGTEDTDALELTQQEYESMPERNVR